MVAAKLALRPLAGRRCLKHHSARLRVQVRWHCELEEAFWTPGKDSICFYHAESWMMDVTWQSAATCVCRPEIGASLNARGIELGGCLWNYCWYLGKVVDAGTDCGTTSQQYQDNSLRFRESTKVCPEKVRWAGEMVRPPRWRLGGRMMSRYINKQGGFGLIG